MNQMFKAFYKVLQEKSLLDSTKKILLAVSGGVDSIVLVALMRKIPHAKRPQIFIAHINHQLRKEANMEEKFVEQIADKHELPFYSYKWAKDTHPSAGIEEAARNQRYTFLKKLMVQHEIDYLMTGHHLDDQTETILMRLTRGASLEQLLGIQVEQEILLENKKGYLIRPLLDFSKEEIYQFAEEKNLNYVEDTSNLESDFTRNRFRNEIIPLLKDENNRFNEHIQQFTSDLSDLMTISEEPIKQAYATLVHSDQEKIKLNLKKFQCFSKAMQRAVITKVLEELYQEETERYKANYIDLVRDWLDEGEVNTSLDLIGSNIVIKGYSEAIFKQKQVQGDTGLLVAAKEFKINTPNQWVKITETESIGLFLKENNHSLVGELKIDELLITEDNLHLPLKIRHRKAGDRMTYQGLSGRKKIKDIFIDDKTSPEDRGKAWIIEDNKDTILWLIGHRKMNLLTDVETDKLLYGLKYVKK